MSTLSVERSAWHRSPWRCEHPYRVSSSVTVRCRKRDCRGCGRWWGADSRAKIRDNLAAYTGHAALVSVTAPGKDVLPWDGERCLSGPLRRWNLAAPGNWRDLHRLASKRARRACKGAKWTVLAKVWQEQKRGALHVHLVVPMATEAEREGSRAYVAALHENRRVYGFGFVDRKLELRSPQTAAGYIARYVSRELAACRNLPGHVVDVSRRLTAQTGVTIRTLRAERAAHMRGRARLDSEADRRMCSEQLRLFRVAPGSGEHLRRSQKRRAPPGSLGLTLPELQAVWGGRL